MCVLTDAVRKYSPKQKNMHFENFKFSIIVIK